MAEATCDDVECKLDADEKEHALSILQSLNNLWKKLKKCDLVIKVEGREIHVHRNVVMAASDFFDAMFSHDTQENRTGVVEMKDLSFGVMKKLVTYIYTGKISVCEKECEPLLYAAGMIQLPAICGMIEKFLQSRIDSSSFFRMRLVAVKFNLKSLEKACDDFALQHLHVLTNQVEFSELDLKYIRFLISTKSLDENTKIAIILRWIKSDVGNRPKHLIELTSLVNLTDVSPTCKKYLAEDEEMCFKSWEFMKMLCLSVINEPKVQANAPVIMSIKQDANAIIVFDKSSNMMQAYQPANESWSKRQELLEEMKGTNFTAFLYKRSAFVLMANKSFFKIDLESSSTWVHLNDMIEKHGNYLRVAGHGDFIYVVGNKTMERYNVNAGTWEKIDKGNFCADESELLEYKGSIYCIGGKRTSAVKDVRMLSPTSLSWSSITPMQFARQTPSAVVHNNKIFVAGGLCGGANPLTSVENFDSENNVWTCVTPMINTHDLFRLFSVNNQLLAIGDKEDLQCSELYESENEQWKVIKGLPKLKIEAQASIAVWLPE